MAHPTLKSIRDQLNFEQKARFDSLYEQREKKLSTATLLSLPLLGTFGLEQFYLGNIASGIVRFVFSFTLIPTFSALLDIVTGDLRRQVDHANARLGRQIFKQVTQSNPLAEVLPQSPTALAAADAIASVTATPPPPAALIATTAAVTAATAASAAVVADAAAAPQVTAAVETPAATIIAATPATETVVASAPSLPIYEAPVVPEPVVTPAPPTVAATMGEITTVDAHEQATTATFTATTTASNFVAGMAEPVTTQDTATATFATSAITEVAQAEAAATVAEEPVTTTHLVAEAQPLEAAGENLAADGVLVFVEDPEAATVERMQTMAAVTPDMTVVSAAAETSQATEVQATVTEVTQVAHSVEHDGKVVAQSRQSTSLHGDVTALLAEQHVAEVTVASRDVAPAGWVDVAPLHGQQPPHVATANVVPEGRGRGPDAGSSDTANGDPPTDVPGAGLGDPPSNVPGAGLGSPPTNIAGGELGDHPTKPPHPPHHTDEPMAE